MYSKRLLAGRPTSPGLMKDHAVAVSSKLATYTVKYDVMIQGCFVILSLSVDRECFHNLDFEILFG